MLGLGDVAMARKDYPAAERYYQQTLRMDSGNTNAVRGLANIYRQQSPEKPKRISHRFASQRRSIDDIERSLQNDRLAQQAEALENQGNGRRRQHFSGNDWRWTPAVYGLLTDFRRISGKPDNAARPIR